MAAQQTDAAPKADTSVAEPDLSLSPDEERSTAQQLEEIEAQTAMAEELERMEGKHPPPGKPALARQYLIVMRHGERIDEVDKGWSALSDRPFDPYLSPHGVEQAKAVADKLRQFNLQRIYISPFLRTIQTAQHCAEELDIPPEKWTITTAVGEFMAPWVLTRKGGKVPPGHINEWFWEKGDMKSTLPVKMGEELAAKVHMGVQDFKRYPENLLNSRVRFARAYQEIADEADGENVLIVTHGDGVNSSVSRIIPWAIVYPVYHTGFVVAQRDKHEDGQWSTWNLSSSSGENGVWWNEKLRPVYSAVKAGHGVYTGVRGAVNWLNPWHHSNGVAKDEEIAK